MLISFTRMIEEFKLNIKGIIQVGAHFGEEVDEYRKNNINDFVLIEPASKAYEILKEKYGNQNNIKLHNVACGSKEGRVWMNIETKNNGQSNSLLEPKLHLLQYPDIVFNDKEMVIVKPLDKMFIDRSKYNMLVMDCQGYEGEILKGAQELLDGIDYVYTEVNFDEVYKDCAKIEEIDALLPEFDRVVTDRSGKTWGDALYVRKKEDWSLKQGIQFVPRIFRPKHPYKYPPDNEVEYERWFFENFNPRDTGERIYLPVFWTAYHVKNNYGNNQAAIDRLQRFIDSLDRTKKYYTIVQYDDGILIDTKGLDIRIFSMSGMPEGSVGIPLIAQRHSYEFDVEKDIYASFVGRITHPIRQALVDLFKDKPGYYISTANHELEDYCRILARSKFVLCPRGYGISSFRIQEALQYGAVPVSISDTFIDYSPSLAFDTRYDLNIFHTLEHLEYQLKQKEILLPVDNEKFPYYYPEYTYKGLKRIMLKGSFDV